MNSPVSQSHLCVPISNLKYGTKQWTNYKLQWMNKNTIKPWKISQSRSGRSSSSSSNFSFAQPAPVLQGRPTPLPKKVAKKKITQQRTQKYSLRYRLGYNLKYRAEVQPESRVFNRANRGARYKESVIPLTLCTPMRAGKVCDNCGLRFSSHSGMI